MITPLFISCSKGWNFCYLWCSKFKGKFKGKALYFTKKTKPKRTSAQPIFEWGCCQESSLYPSRNRTLTHLFIKQTRYHFAILMGWPFLILLTSVFYFVFLLICMVCKETISLFKTFFAMYPTGSLFSNSIFNFMSWVSWQGVECPVYVFSVLSLLPKHMRE